MRHDYLRKSMVDRIERKSLLVKYQRDLARSSKDRSMRMTRAAHLRSQSVLDHMNNSGAIPESLKSLDIETPSYVQAVK